MRRTAGRGTGSRKARETGSIVHGIAVLNEGHAMSQPAPDAHSDLPRIPRGQSLRPAPLDVVPAVEGRRPRGTLVRRALAVSDALSLTAAFLVALLLFPPEAASDNVRPPFEVLLFALSLPFWIVLLKLHGLYDRDDERADHSTVDDILGIFQAVTAGAWGVVLLGLVTGLVSPSVTRVATFWATSIALVPVLRATARAFCRSRPAYRQNVIILGAGQVGQMVALKILDHEKKYGIKLLGFVDEQPRDLRPDLEARLPVLLGGPSELESMLERLQVDRVIVAFSNDRHDRILDVIRSVRRLDIQVDIVPRFFEVIGTNMTPHTLEGVPLVGLAPFRLSRSARLLKRSLDVLVSSVGLVVATPVLLVAAIAIKATSSGPVFFRQVRMGAGDRAFKIVKLRTMYADAEERKRELDHLNVHGDTDPRMFKVEDDPRITPVGRFFRRWAVDELPQLVNVLRGEMSMVGPRPLILDEDQHVTDWARTRLDLKPGLTGLWQVLGRSDIPFDEMTRLDYLYVTNWTLSQDLRLILLTLPSIVRPPRAV